MPLTRRPELCEICDKIKFLSSLKCQHRICLECKMAIAKIEERPKCPYCRIQFCEKKKVIESREEFKKKVEDMLSEINWESCSVIKETEYNSEPTFWASQIS